VFEDNALTKMYWLHCNAYFELVLILLHLDTIIISDLSCVDWVKNYIHLLVLYKYLQSPHFPMCSILHSPFSNLSFQSLKLFSSPIWFSPKPHPNPTFPSTPPSLLAMSELHFPGMSYCVFSFRTLNWIFTPFMCMIKFLW